MDVAERHRVEHSVESGFEPGVEPVVQPGVDEWLARAHAAIDALSAAASSPCDAARLVPAVERLVRRLEAVTVRAIDAVDRSGIDHQEGHRSIAAWCRASVRWSYAEANDRVRTMRVAREVAEVSAVLDAGTAPVASVRALARSASNSRCRAQMASAAPELLDEATRMPVDEFTRLVRRVEDYLDADGAHGSAQHAHAARSAWVAVVGREVHLRASFGAAQGAFVREVFERYVRGELDGDPERTSAQCRADALHAIFLAAAGGPVRAVPTVNVVVDQATFESALAETVVGSPQGWRSYRCQTLDGDPLDPYDVAVAALIGHVRRVVLGAQGVPIDLGRRVRLFRGGVRDAVWLAHGRSCIFPGCDARFCDVDHGRGWSGEGGATAVANGVPLCDRHNRWKHERGYRIWRDPAGTWHTVRPDGSEAPPAV